jgi:hypothetical protein
VGVRNGSLTTSIQVYLLCEEIEQGVGGVVNRQERMKDYFQLCLGLRWVWRKPEKEFISIACFYFDFTFVAQESPNS